MKELFEKFLMYFCFAGIGTIAVVSFVRVTLPTAAIKARSAARKVRKAGPAVIIPIVCVAGMIVFGSTKNNTQTNEPPAQTQMLSQPAVRGDLQIEKIVAEALEAQPIQKVGIAAVQSLNECPVPTNLLVRVEKWWRRGAYNDGQVITFDDDWCLPYGTNHLTGVEIWASGAIYASMKDPSPIVELGTKLSVAPQDTEVLVGRTTNNTYRIEWHNGHPNRDVNQTADASIELFRNGNIIVTEGGVSTEIPYDPPFEHVGYGQNDDWVRAYFANAEEIISVGYTNWVVQTVGENVANGLFYLKATFDEDPPEPCQLSVGGYSVAVNERGEYFFILPVFDEHELRTWPSSELVRYEIEDGCAGEGCSYRLHTSPMFASRALQRGLMRTPSEEDLQDGVFSVEPLVVTDPPRIPVRVAENANVSAFWNVSSLMSLLWTDQQGEVEFSDATSATTSISNVRQPTTLAVAMNDGTHEATGYVAIHGDGEDDGEEQIERSDAGSGINDGAVTSASDLEVDDFPALWFAFSGRGAAGEDCRLTHDFEIPAGRACYIGMFAGSQEYSEWTGRDSQYNDRIYWNIKTNHTANVRTLRRYVNELHGDFAEAEENDHTANGLVNAVPVDGIFLTAGTNSLPVTLTLAVINVGDGKRESTGLFGVFPVSIIQSNYPRATGRYSSTDDGGAGTNGLIRAGGVAYITGEPAMATLTAKIRNLPDWLKTAWSGNLTTERPERGTRDDRVLVAATNLLGAAAYDITAALTNEVVGGKCVLRSRVDDRVTGTHEFSIRGKNPLDATVRTYMTANIDEEFRPYVWKIAKHETIVGLNTNSQGIITNAVCYNQFNPRGLYKELPDFGSPDGWGIGQIDRSRNEGSEFNYTTTKEVYNWHESIDSMNSVLREKKDMYLEIVGWFRTQYQNDPSTNWVEPNVTTNVSGVVLTAREWSIMTMYNGSGGCPRLNIPGRPGNRSPIHFDPRTSRWILYTNTNNYVPKVMSESGAEEVD